MRKGQKQIVFVHTVCVWVLLNTVACGGAGGASELPTPTSTTAFGRLIDLAQTLSVTPTPALTPALGVAARLDVPYLSQIESNECGTTGMANCGPASLAMVAEYYGLRPVFLVDDSAYVREIRVEIKGMVGEKEYSCGQPDVWESEIAAWLTDHGLNYYRVGTLTEVLAATQEGHPGIVAVLGDELVPAQSVPVETWFGHNNRHVLVVTGEASLNGESVVYVNDPLCYLDGKACPEETHPGYYERKAFQAAMEHHGMRAFVVTGGRGEVLSVEVTREPTQEGFAAQRLSAENAQDLALLARFGTNVGGGLSFTPAGDYLVLGSSAGVLIYSAQTREQVAFWPLAGGILSVDSSPDGTTVATGSGDGYIRQWDLESGSVRDAYYAHPNGVRFVAYSPDGTAFAAGSRDGSMGLWSFWNGLLVYAQNWDVWGGYGTSRVTFIANDTYLRSDLGLPLAVSGDGTVVAIASQEAVQLWRAADWSLLRSLAPDCGDSITGAALMPDASLVAVVCSDGVLRVYSVADGELLARLGSQSDAIAAAEFSPAGTALATTMADGTVAVWGIPEGGEAATPGYAPTAIAPATDDDLPPVGWTYISRGTVADVVRLRQWDAGVASAAYSADSCTLALGRASSIALYDLPTLSEYTSWGVTSRVWGIAFSPDGTLIAAGLGDGAVQILARDGTIMHTLRGQSDRINSVAFSPDGQLLASGSEDCSVRLWRVSDGTLMHDLQGHTGPVNWVGFSPNGTLLGSGGTDKPLRIWSASDGSLLFSKPSDSRMISAAFTPDGSAVAFPQNSSSIRVEAISERSVLRRMGSSGWMTVYGLAFSPDGSLLAVASGSQSVELWDAQETSELLRRIGGFSVPIRSVSFSPDSTTLAAVGLTGGLAIYGVPQSRVPAIRLETPSGTSR